MKRAKLLATVLSIVMVFGMLSVIASATEYTGTQLSVHSFSSEQIVEGGVTTDGSAALAVDGNTATAWNDEYVPESDPPNWIVFDLGSAKTVTGFKELPRQDGYAGLENGNIRDYTLYGSTNGTDFTEIKSGSFDDTSAAWQSTTFTGVSARYIKIQQPTSGANNYVAIAEVVIVTSETNPQTGDSGMLWLVLVAAASALVLVMFRRTSRSKN